MKSHTYSALDFPGDGYYKHHDDEFSKWYVSGTPLATSCNGQPCKEEDEFPWNDVRLPTFINPIRYDIELTPNLTTLVVKGKFLKSFVEILIPGHTITCIISEVINIVYSF